RHHPTRQKAMERNDTQPVIYSESLKREYLLAAIAIAPVLLTAYQTMTLFDVTGDVVRKAIEVDSYTMAWVTLWSSEALLFGMIGGAIAMTRIGRRNTVIIGLLFFAFGSFLSGMAANLTTLAAGRIVLYIGKGMV